MDSGNRVAQPPPAVRKLRSTAKTQAGRLCHMTVLKSTAFLETLLVAGNVAQRGAIARAGFNGKPPQEEVKIPSHDQMWRQRQLE